MLKRFFLRWKWMRDYEKSLNERAKVEEELIAAALGRVPMPDKEKLRNWACRLGVPKEWRS